MIWLRLSTDSNGGQVTVVLGSTEDFVTDALSGGAKIANNPEFTGWLALIGGNAPSAAAPADYQYLQYPFLVTVRNGAILEVHQIWVPDR